MLQASRRTFILIGSVVAITAVACMSASRVPVGLAENANMTSDPTTYDARRLGLKLLSTGDSHVRFSDSPQIRTVDGVEKMSFCVQNPSSYPKHVTVFAGSLWTDVGTLAPGEERCSQIDRRGPDGAVLRLEEHAPW